MKVGKSIFPRTLTFALSLVIVLAAAQAQAIITTYSSRDTFDAAFPSASVENWDSFPSGTVLVNGGTYNGITYNVLTPGADPPGNALVTRLPIPTTETNSLGQSLDGFFYPQDSVTFNFATPIRAFGIDISTFATANGTYVATTDRGDVALSVFNFFPGYGTGQFLGFSSNVEFSWVIISSADPININNAFTLDTMRYYIPLPPTLLLFGSGLAGLVLWRLRKRSKA